MLAIQQQHSLGLPLPLEQRFQINKAEQLIANLATRGPRSHGTRKPDPRPPSVSKTQDRTPPALQHQKRHHNSMLAARGRDVRRERTFVGTSCAVCEEPLEHTLRGERILQLSCGHVTHQACFYEFTKELVTESPQCPTCHAPLGLDPSRGVTADFDNLHRLVRAAAAATPDMSYSEDNRPITSNESNWDPDSLLRSEKMLSSTRHTRPPSERDLTKPDRPRVVQDWQHADGGGQHGAASNGRKPEFDVRSMETTTTATPSQSVVNIHIPTPVVTVRSEYPTLSRSKHQQSLTCLVTVEVSNNTKWPAVPADLHSRPSQTLKKSSPKKQPYTFGTTAADEDVKQLNTLKDELFAKVENWHGLDYSRFGKLLLYGTMRVGKDKQSWQDLDCYLFTQMLICVKEKRNSNASQEWTATNGTKSQTKCALKGSILIKRHLQHVQYVPSEQMLSLSLSVAELPYFHLQFQDRKQLDQWRTLLTSVEKGDPTNSPEYGNNASVSDDDYDDDATTDGRDPRRRVSTLRSSSHGPPRSPTTTAATEYTNPWSSHHEISPSAHSIHVPIDIVVVVPVSATTTGLKNQLLRDAIRFLVSGLGGRDRIALVTFGSSAGGVPLVGMNSKQWSGWSNVIDQIQPDAGKTQRADVVDGANVAMDLLMQRRIVNPLSSILLISDSPVSDVEGVDFVVSRAEAAKITIQSFGLGLTHKPDTMVELSTRTKGAYTFVKDWMMLRECLAGCLGSLQSTSHQNVKIKLHLPEGSQAKFVKISGALQITKRAAGRDAEASLGDLRFGDRRDILVQLAIPPDGSIAEPPTSDPWEHIISNLEALGGSDTEELRASSIEEMPLLQADLTWGDVLRDGSLSQLPRQSLLAITMLQSPKKDALPSTPPIPPHPSVVQRRMELLTSDMLNRALVLVARNQADRAHHLLTETRSILKGLGKGGLPPLPPNPASRTSRQDRAETPSPTAANVPLPSSSRTPTPPRSDALSLAPGAGIDQGIIAALDFDLESSLEYISHADVFNRDSRKSVLQSMGVIGSQRAFTYRTPAESLWASRIPGIQRLLRKSQDWREYSEQHAVQDP